MSTVKCSVMAASTKLLKVDGHNKEFEEKTQLFFKYKASTN